MLIKKFLENMCNVLKIICTLRKEKNIQHRIHVYIYIYIYIYIYKRNESKKKLNFTLNVVNKSCEVYKHADVNFVKSFEC